MKRVISVALVAISLAGCARNPNVSFTYYPVKWKSSASIFQTIACNATKTRLTVLNAPTVTTSYSSNLANPKTLNIKRLDKWFADSELTLGLTEDGRLKSINQSTTGQGEAIIKSAVSLAAAAAPFAGLAAVAIPECDTVEKFGGGKPVTLTYRNDDIDSKSFGTTLTLKPSQDSDDVFRRLQGRLPDLRIEVAKPQGIQAGVQYDPNTSGDSDDVVLLDLQRIDSVRLIFSATDKTTRTTEEVGTSSIVVPDIDPTHLRQLPIPKAALFGKQAFTLTLSEAGAITSVGYVKTNGVSSALNALGAIANTQTATTKAAELQAEADLIAQQQRLAQCKAKPEDCK